MSLGSVIKSLRERKNWSQGMLAIRADVDQSYLSRIERDLHENVSVKVVIQLATALNSSVDAILIEAGMLDPPESGEPWAYPLVVMQRALNLYPPGSDERRNIEAVIIAQAEAYLRFHKAEQGD